MAEWVVLSALSRNSRSFLFHDAVLFNNNAIHEERQLTTKLLHEVNKMNVAVGLFYDSYASDTRNVYVQ